MPLPIPGRVAEALRRSTVQVRRGNERYQAGGSGVALLDGQIVTNAHVVGDSREVVVENWDGESSPATVVKRDTRRDLVLLSVPQLKTQPLMLADSDRVRPGLPVIAVGNPLGFVGAASSGIVSAAGARWIEADVHLAPGNSGVPLANLQGEVIGINTMVMARRFGHGLAFAIPSRAVQSFLTRNERRRNLGLTIRPVQLPNRSMALLILELLPGGPAENASLMAGDLLLAANGSALREPDDLADAIDSGAETLRLQFHRGSFRYRNGSIPEPRPREVVVRLGAKPVEHAAA